MAGRHAIAIDIGRRELRALEAMWDRERLRVGRVLVEPIPDDVGPDDPRSLGVWAGRTLNQAGFGKGRAVAVVSREHVVLKRIALPTAEPRELPEMTRLALHRELPFDPTTAIIDFVLMAGGGTSTTVLAVAVPQGALVPLRQAVRGAGRSLEHLSLRNMGVAALLDPDSAEPVLAVDITAERVEFTVVVDGVIRFSRAGELPALEDPAEITAAVVTEARRTWMSYRIVQDSEDVCRAVVFGDPRVAEPAASAIGEILKVETSVFNGHGLVEGFTGGSADGELWPLVGLLLVPNIRIQSIDFAHPRRAPDVRARKRRIAIGVAGLAVVIFMAGMTWARFDLADLQQTVAQLQEKRTVRRPQYLRYGRDLYKLTHLQQWESVDPEWLEHLAYIASLSPPPDRVVLDTWAGTLAFGGVKFDRRSQRFSAPAEIRIAVEGEAADRETADAFRGSLVDTEAYDISTAGPDAQSGRRLPYSFQYNLRTSGDTPVSRDEPPPEAGGQES